MSSLRNMRCMSTASAGRVWSWGRGASRDAPSTGLFGGLFGRRTGGAAKSSASSSSHVPAPVSDLPEGIVKLDFSDTNSIALAADGTVYTWGSDRYALGHGPKVRSQPTPKAVSALKGIEIVDVSVGAYHAAAVSSEGELFTWGFGGSMMRQGALGHGDSTD